MTMDSPPKLTGETLIVHHIPLVHCQVPDRQCCGTSKRTNPFCQPDLGVARTSSLPERDLAQSDSLVYSSLLQASEPAPVESPEGQDSRAQDATAPGAHKRHNPFLGSATEAPGLCNGDPTQRSFHLHGGKSAFHLQELPLPPFHLHDASLIVKPWSAPSRLDVVEGCEDRLLGDDGQRRGCLAPEFMELDEYGCQRGEASSLSLEQEWAADPHELPHEQEAARSRTCSCSSGELQRCRCCSLSSQSEPLDQHMGYVSDSSCNSSDGILVNFSTLYHKAGSHSRSSLNSAALSCGSSSGSPSDPAAFYLDLHSSPVESKMSCESPPRLEGSGRACGCPHTSSPVLDANCNSYPPLCDPCTSEESDLTACFQSQARLVVATQNYYKLVTCDLSSQSSPSPAGSSITSCSEEHTRGSPVQPAEYYLFQRPREAQQEESDPDCSREDSQGSADQNGIQGQVYVNISPPMLASGRQRSRSYDRNLNRSPSGRLGSLERMMSCPVKLSDSPALASQSSPPKRVTSFAELAKGRKKTGSSPPLRSSQDSSLEFSPIPEYQRDASVFLEERGQQSQGSFNPSTDHGLSASGRDWSSREVLSSEQGGPEQLFLSALAEAGAGPASSLGQKDIRARADGGAADSKAVVRYSKDQRPTTLPIQPFVFQHHFPKQPKARALHSHFAASLSQLYSLSAASRSASQPLSSTSQASTTSADQPMVVGALVHGQRSADGAAALGEGYAQKPVPETTRPSPLGSYSPVRSSSTVPFFPTVESSSPALESHPPRSRSCPVSANLLPTRPSLATGSLATLHKMKKESSTSLPEKEEPPEQLPAMSNCTNHGSALLAAVRPAGPGRTQAENPVEPQWKAGCGEALGVGLLSAVAPRPLNANHLSPQALKWREYRRRNPLGLDHSAGLAGLRGSLDWKPQEGRLPWRTPLFELPGQSVKQLQLNYSEFFPDYFSLAEKPPAEFCLSPDGNTESISIDLLQKKGLVKAINMAVDLIVAHFGTSRDPGVKAKLGNSSVSPNVGHLILKYLCPAIHGVLSDGLKAYVLDVIVGQRRNVPWSVVEASTQLGPSTKVLHSLCSQVGQYPELTSHRMRFNAFIFGLLNIRSLEFWFNHLYSHEDIIQLHYQPSGFLSLAPGVCQGLFEEVLLLLQPLSLLPFSVDLLFEHHLLQVGRQQQQQKELLRVRQDLLLSAHSTLQLMRSRGSSAQEAGGESWEAPQNGLVAEEGRAKGVGAPSGSAEREEAVGPKQDPGSAPDRRKDKQASWWFQLMQSSQVYIEGSPEGSRSARCERRRKVAGLGAVSRPAVSVKGPPPHPREGVVDGAEACPLTEGPAQQEAEPTGRPAPTAREEPKERSRPFWMGSPPDSVLTELKRTQDSEGESGPAQKEGAPAESGQPKWGRLFGSRKLPRDPKQASRLPSGWLSLDRSVLQLVAQTVGAGVRREAAAEPKRLPSEPPPSRPKPVARRLSPEPPWEVKALCHHIATAAGQLSFKKGDILRVLGKAEADWLQCSRGTESGLVPIMYVTHPEDEDY
ncbi:AP-4 complex accessory subunit RUSC2 isoform X2 [Tiliqua scincoides]|uniref:AP-4 complex accessory subunit RUSC2 isoform X2 n=1 Tax=Tiliqua scincoides TaxID=71010 RepID=UPI0034637404